MQTRGRFYISRRAMLAASERPGIGQPYRVEGLEALARHLHVELPHMPRHWHGYRLALIRKLQRHVSEPREAYPGEVGWWD